MCESVVNNAVIKCLGCVIEIDPERRYCIEVPARISVQEFERIMYRWNRMMTGETNLFILDGGAKIARIQEPDDPDHSPNP